MPRKLGVGIYLENACNIQDSLQACREAGFDYVCCELLTEEYRKKALLGVEKDGEVPFSKWFDMSVSAGDWSSSVVGVLSDLQEHTDGPIPIIRERACNLLSKELGYAQHLSLMSTIVRLHPGEATNFGRLLHSRITNEGGNHSNLFLWVKFPMTFTKPAAANGVNDEKMDTSVSESSSEGGISSWNIWNRFRISGTNERRTFPILDIPVDLPDDDEINRWLGEHVRAICLSEDIFTTNAKGFPVLPKRTQDVLKKFMDIGCHIILSCKPGNEPCYYLHFKQYVEYLYSQLSAEWEEDHVRKYTKGYEDYLQSPLQPLMDNLEANTYEVFERDPTKYELYQKAIAKALVHKVPEEEKDTKTLVVMVVGAGRGPLVRNCLAAAESVNRQIKLFAIEKNVNAVCTLLHLKKHVWGEKVTVVSTDMREFKPEEKADILISELLGSFGDNELSPECLDGAQLFLKEDGIMIPESYTSYISPVMSPKLHCDVRSFYDQNKHSLSNYETPYVVYLKNYYEIDRPKELFEFRHPKSEDTLESNDRYAMLEFTASLDCLMHGVAGYFESHLFGGVKMSIHPDTHSEGMFSWFPIFFPIREPVQIKRGETVKVHFWRCSNKHNVWYEWTVSAPNPIPIHNVNGRSYTIGL